MTIWQLIRRGLWYHRRDHAGVVLGVAITCAVLTGALAVGDSVRQSLHRIAAQRLGGVAWAMRAGDRFVRAQLADDMADALAVPAAPIVLLAGVATTPDGQKRANRVNIVGVDQRFWSLGGVSSPLAPDAVDTAAVNGKLAAQLGLTGGETLILRIEKPSFLPRDAVIASTENVRVALRVTVGEILDAERFGNFNLEANQLAPANIFVPLATFQAALDRPGRANAILLGQGGEDDLDPDTALKQTWRLEDTQIEVVGQTERERVEVRTERIFFDAGTGAAIAGLLPGSTGLLTYLVNGIAKGERTIPYSMVTAIDADGLETGLAEDAILLNEWAAADLQAEVGDRIELSFFAVDQANRLRAERAHFTVAGMVPTEGGPVDPAMMPAFPGLEGSRDCRDWDTGIPMDLDQIRDKDEAYWDRYKGTPKALIALAAGQRIWENRFGSLTAIRFPGDEETANRLRREIPAALAPTALGLFFLPVGDMARQAADQGMDFGMLFIAFSFFVILAALLLTALLFVFSFERRLPEMGALLAMGLPYRRLRALYLGEACLLCLPGALAGVVFGLLYANGILTGLLTLWRDAVGDWSIAYHASATSLIAGAAGGAVLALLTIAFCFRRVRRASITRLLGGVSAPVKSTRAGGRLSRWLAVLCALLAVAILVLAARQPGQGEAGWFFLCGALLLGAGLFGFAALLAGGGTRIQRNLFHLAAANLKRGRGRSLAIAAMLACGTFLVVALESQRQYATTDSQDRASGTGGFALIGEVTQPLYRDLNTPQGLDHYGLVAEDLGGAAFIPMRVLSGDDASCLNLNRASQPELLGVDALAFNRRGAFSFARVAGDAENPWLLLNEESASGEVAAIGDFNTLTYSLKVPVGGTLDFVDERGETFTIRIIAALANSIFQGGLIIAESAFTHHFPANAGYRRFLIDAPGADTAALAADLESGLGDLGMAVTPTVDRLNAYNRVQNTYISIFQMLGALGLILGSLGLGVVVLRNVLERRPELALMRAVGFPQRALRRLLLLEHWALLAVGLLCGTLAALIAVLPRLMLPGAPIPWTTLVITQALLILSGFFWIWLAAAMALRGDLLPALRRE